MPKYNLKCINKKNTQVSVESQLFGEEAHNRYENEGVKICNECLFGESGICLFQIEKEELEKHIHQDCYSPIWVNDAPPIDEPLHLQNVDESLDSQYQNLDQNLNGDQLIKQNYRSVLSFLKIFHERTNLGRNTWKCARVKKKTIRWGSNTKLVRTLQNSQCMMETYKLEARCLEDQFQQNAYRIWDAIRRKQKARVIKGMVMRFLRKEGSFMLLFIKVLMLACKLILLQGVQQILLKLLKLQIRIWELLRLQLTDQNDSHIKTEVLLSEQFICVFINSADSSQPYFQIICINPTLQIQQIQTLLNCLFRSTVPMITNFQLKAKICKYHGLPESFICMSPECQYRALMCSDCTRQNHANHFHDVKTLETFIGFFKGEVNKYQKLFQKDKVVINVKEIIRTKVCELQQILNQILIKVVKMLDKEKESLIEKLRDLQAKYESAETDYKANLQIRYDCLEYLQAYRDCPKALEAKLHCSSEWGIVSLKNSLSDIKTYSLNKSRNVNGITDQIIAQADKVLNEDCFLYGLKRFIHDFGHLQSEKKGKVSSFIEKSFLTSNTKNTTLSGTPKSSRVISRSRVQSLAGIRHVSSNQSLESRHPSLEHIMKMPSEKYLGNDKYLKEDKYLRGIKNMKLSRVIIK